VDITALTARFVRFLFQLEITFNILIIRDIIDRLDAVENLQKNPKSLQNLKEVLSTVPDLDRALCRIYYHRASPYEVLLTLQSFKKIFEALPDEDEVEDEISSKYLKELVLNVPNLLKLTKEFYNKLNSEEISEKTQQNSDIFKDLEYFPDVKECKKVISIST
jgi:DNA mismatch repair protein MSH3